MASSAAVKVAFVVVICVTLAAAPQKVEAGISCGQVTSKLAPCISYLTKPAGAVPANCCAGIKNINAAAKTTADRQTACGCLKSASNSLPPSVVKGAEGLPGKCGVSVPYKISPNTDCSKVK